MGNYIIGAGRAFVLFFLVAMFSLVACNTTPAYADGAYPYPTYPNPNGWPTLSGTYYYGFASDNSGQLSPASASSSEGALYEALSAFPPYGNGTVSGSISSSLSQGWGASASYTVSCALGGGESVSFSANPGTNPSLLLSAGGEVVRWDTLTFTSVLSSYPVTAFIPGDYTTTGENSGNAQLVIFYPDPTHSYYDYEAGNQSFEGTASGTLSVSQTFLMSYATAVVQLIWELQGNAENAGTSPATFSIDPGLSLTLPEGVTYKDASGADYGGDFLGETGGGGVSAIPEPATLTLLGLGLTGLVAKFARRRNR